MLGAKVSGHKLTSINEIMPMIGARFYGHIESMQLKNDYLEDELSKVIFERYKVNCFCIFLL